MRAEAGNEDLVIRHQRREVTMQTGLGKAIKGELGFPRSGRAEKDKSGRADDDRRSVDIGALRAHVAASTGSESMKRAPRMRPLAGSMMFSAFKVPPCASAICRLMDRPSPEFWPKLSPSGRSV